MFPWYHALFDDYSGRSGLLKQNEMSIKDHFFWGHDMKFHGDSLFPEHFGSRIRNGEYARMNDEQKAAWDAAYNPKNEAFPFQYGKRTPFRSLVFAISSRLKLWTAEVESFGLYQS